MTHLLNLLAAIALLVWGTHIVRAGMLRVFGEKLRSVLARSTRNRFVNRSIKHAAPPTAHCKRSKRKKRRSDNVR